MSRRELEELEIFEILEADLDDLAKVFLDISLMLSSPLPMDSEHAEQSERNTKKKFLLN